MKVRIFSEEFGPDGIQADWPMIPRIDEIATFHHRGGGSNLKVNDIRWQFDTSGKFIEVEVYLTF